MLAFSIWMLWSVVVVNLDRAGFMLSKNQMFWLTALPALSGATPHLLFLPGAGVRRPQVDRHLDGLAADPGAGHAARSVHLPSGRCWILALLCGLGGGNFSSSMANISFFPSEKKGLATGLNAGITWACRWCSSPCRWRSRRMFGALGGERSRPWSRARRPISGCRTPVSSALPIALLLAAWFGMNGRRRASFADQAVIFAHNWLMCWLYVGTFAPSSSVSRPVSPC